MYSLIIMHNGNGVCYKLPIIPRIGDKLDTYHYPWPEASRGILEVTDVILNPSTRLIPEEDVKFYKELTAKMGVVNALVLLSTRLAGDNSLTLTTSTLL